MSGTVELWVERNAGAHPMMPRYAGIPLASAQSIATDLAGLGLFRRVEIRTDPGRCCPESYPHGDRDE